MLANIDEKEKRMILSEKLYKSLVRSYKKFLFDKRNYIVTYYKKGNQVGYVVSRKKKIGFRK